VRVHIDLDRCQGHGQCQAVAPRVFFLGEDDRAHLQAPGQDISAADEQAVEDAIVMCPEAAISREAPAPGPS
jgi:ferredoxin